MDIKNCIAELLSLHDCVIVPGFGGFIGNYSPARIDPVHHTFQPPSKKVLFNINLKQNDGLLANAVADSFGATYNDACRMIDEFAEEIRFTLKSENPFILPGVGQLYSGLEGIIHFDQDQNSNLLPDAFGLVTFISPPVIRNSSSLRHGWTLSKRGIVPSGKKYFLPRALKWAAVATLVIGIGGVIGVTQYHRHSSIFTDKAGILSSGTTKVPATSVVAERKLPVANAIKTAQPASVSVPAAQAPVNILSIRQDDRFAVIIGAFRLEGNAQKLVAELQQKGITASIFDQSKTGLYRVTIGTTSDRAAARQILASAKTTDFSGAWILAK